MKRPAVPEAAVDEDGEFFSGEGDVGANKKVMSDE